MPDTITADEMRALEQAAIDSGKVTGLELMERAGQGVVEAIFEEWPELADGSHKAVVLCGPGNNGGDGFVVARLLKERGFEVEVFLYGDPENLPPDAKTNYEQWLKMGNVHSLSGEFYECGNRYEAVVRDLQPQLVIDALFGIGLTRELPHILGDIVYYWPEEFRDESGARYVAIDMPSGVSSETGLAIHGDEFEEPVANVNLTVTFHSLKPGHLRSNKAKYYAPNYCGKVVVKDIGL